MKGDAILASEYHREPSTHGKGSVATPRSAASSTRRSIHPSEYSSVGGNRRPGVDASRSSSATRSKDGDGLSIAYHAPPEKQSVYGNSGAHSNPSSSHRPGSAGSSNATMPYSSTLQKSPTSLGLFEASASPS